MGCGGNGAGGGAGTSNPVTPVTITLNSTGAWNVTASGINWVTAGTPSFLLLVDGKGFTSSSVVQWNGEALQTSFGESTDLAAQVPASLVALPGTAQVTVYDSSENATSNVISFGIASPAAATAGVVQMITVAPDGTPANNNSLVQPSIGTTGRYVAFQSAATNLVPGHGGTYQEIFERDTCIGAPTGCTPTTIAISVTYDGSAVNGHSRDSAISGDGRYVAFDSQATNILNDPATSSRCNPNASSCVYLRDTCIGAPAGCAPSTILVSSTVSGAWADGGNPTVTPDGRYVAFESAGEATGVADNIFLYDTCNGISSNCAPSTSLISESNSGAEADSQSYYPSISSTGRYVAFTSYADNLAGQNPNERDAAFLRDNCLGAAGSCTPSTIALDETPSGGEPDKGVSVGFGPSISSDGRLVAFASDATDLVTPNLSITGAIFVHDTCNGASAPCTPATTLVSLGNDGSIPDATQNNETMSADGRFVAFASLANNLVPGDTFAINGWKDIFVRDTCYGAPAGCTPSTVRVSVSNVGGFAVQSNAINDEPIISGDGHYVVFMRATNFLSTGGNGYTMVYLAKTGF